MAKEKFTQRKPAIYPVTSYPELARPTRGFDAPASGLPLQTKLTVNEPGDQYEKEADSVASQVMRMSEPSSGSLVQREASDDEELQMKPLAGAISSLVQREASDDEELQMKESGDQTTSQDVSGVVSQGLAGGGSSLDGDTQSFMETRFGHDFSQVKVHTDGAASESAQSVAARAYTVGSDIAFSSGEYSPGSSGGRELLAHELTHVVQQGQAAPISTVQKAPGADKESRE